VQRQRWMVVFFLVWMVGLNTACQYVQVEESEPENMVLVPAGWFWMGDSAGPPASRPGHWVYLDRFAIDRTEVTDQAFADYIMDIGDQPAVQARAGFSAQGGEPAVGVTWEQAQDYCQWVGKRLPSEAEWEKAARGTDGRRYPWGNSWETELANTAESRTGRVLPVGSYPAGASPYGALDMSGNAAEWVADYFSSTYYSLVPAFNPHGPGEVLDHGLRGGSWDSPYEQSTTFFRDSSHSVRSNLRAGFRCAMSLND
jgi:formylglycine-generating enzyme required for sulfatase activity